VRIPAAAAGSGKATVTLSFPGWEDGIVEPATAVVEILDGEQSAAVRTREALQRKRAAKEQVRQSLADRPWNSETSTDDEVVLSDYLGFVKDRSGLAVTIAPADFGVKEKEALLSWRVSLKLARGKPICYYLTECLAQAGAMFVVEGDGIQIVPLRAESVLPREQGEKD
jgi:hypothetical protein